MVLKQSPKVLKQVSKLFHNDHMGELYQTQKFPEQTIESQ